MEADKKHTTPIFLDPKQMANNAKFAAFNRNLVEENLQWIRTKLKPDDGIVESNMPLAGWFNREVGRVMYDLFIVRDTIAWMCMGYLKDDRIFFCKIQHLDRCKSKSRKLRDAILTNSQIVNETHIREKTIDPVFERYVSRCTGLFTRMVDQDQRALKKLMEIADASSVDEFYQKNQALLQDLHAFEERATTEPYVYLYQTMTTPSTWDAIDATMTTLISSMESVEVK